ncbi:MAG: glucose-6-phosphate isomerase [Methanomassiliicoccaceae archaeon]|nr:glucose-6-phosphate isomerase [Methanomassiliicoccaceae archaeon]
MGMLKLDLTHAGDLVSEQELESLKPQVDSVHYNLHKDNGPENEHTGWLDLPNNYDKEEFEKIKECASKIRSDSEILVLVGVGGSYLGARAAIDALSHSFSHLDKSKRNGPWIIYAGNSMSSTYLSEVMEIIENRDISLNVVSKSGSTTEPALAFRMLRTHMEEKYGERGAAERIYTTTDTNHGALKKLSDRKGYTAFDIPSNIGGRYSVLTAAGLLPIATAGIDIDSMMKGARQAFADYSTPDLFSNDCYLYAAARNVLYKKSKTTEILVNYEPNLHYFGEWWKQLYGESEGKGQNGIFPASVNFTTDLHSIGQYIQDGIRNIFETVLCVETPKKNLNIETDEEDLDGLNFLSDKSLDYINKTAMISAIKAHVDGGTPNLIVEVPALDAASFGSLVYFFEKACAVSGYLFGVNPFDQPGVEKFKNNMFRLLGKPGY